VSVSVLVCVSESALLFESVAHVMCINKINTTFYMHKTDRRSNMMEYSKLEYSYFLTCPCPRDMADNFLWKFISSANL